MKHHIHAQEYNQDAQVEPDHLPVEPDQVYAQVDHDPIPNPDHDPNPDPSPEHDPNPDQNTCSLAIGEHHFQVPHEVDIHVEAWLCDDGGANHCGGGEENSVDVEVNEDGDQTIIHVHVRSESTTLRYVLHHQDEGK